MAVRTLYGRSAKAPSAINAAEAIFAEGRIRMLSPGTFAILNGDDANNKCYCGKVPSSAIPLKGHSTLLHSAITGLSDVDIGLEKDGTTVELDILADGLDLSSGAAKDPFASVSVANTGKRLWELLGLATDPAVEYDVVMTLKVAAGGNGNITPQLPFVIK